jgi:DNA-binding GntR family transcriptional regulator
MGTTPDGHLDGFQATPSAAHFNSMTKADHVYFQIRGEILEGRLEPGAPLDQESLAGRLGVSTTPLREALRRLEAEKLVISRAHRDTIVAPLSLENLLHVYAVRLALDPLAAELAAREATDAQLASMQTSFAHHGGHSAVDLLHRNRRVHRMVYESCGNAVLVEILDRLWDLSDRYRLLTLREESTAQSAEDEHHEIVDAIVNRDSERARALMHAHVLHSFEHIRSSGDFTEPAAHKGDAQPIAVRKGDGQPIS